MCCKTMGTLKRQFTSSWQRSEKASWRKVISELNFEGRGGVRPITGCEQELVTRNSRCMCVCVCVCRVENWVELHVVIGT